MASREWPGLPMALLSKPDEATIMTVSARASAPALGDMRSSRPVNENLTTEFDDFLFATFFVEANGMQLSVVSALARAGLDPWRESARLAALAAEDRAAPVSLCLDLGPRRGMTETEAAAIAKRLAALLPARPGEAQASTAREGPVPSQQTNYRFMILVIAIVLSQFVLHSRAAKTIDGGPPPATVSSPSSTR